MVDTNILISAAVFRCDSVPYHALLRAFESGDVLCSQETRAEAREVIAREKFNRFSPFDLRISRLNLILDQMKEAEPVPCESGCRDPKDEKFLELAVGGAHRLF